MGGQNGREILDGLLGSDGNHAERELLCEVIRQAFSEARLIQHYDLLRRPLTKSELKRQRAILYDGDPATWVRGDGGHTVCVLLDIDHRLIVEALDTLLDS
jgi:hypothetical protein